MRTPLLMVAVAALALPFAAHAETPSAPHAQATVPAYVTKAINDLARKADKADDARRKMAAVMTFTGVKPGDTVIELSPGTGYWTRVFSRIVGPHGHVYQVWPKEMAKYSAKSMANWRKLAATPHYANVSVLEEPLAMVGAPKKADIVFTANNYHDFHNVGIDIESFDKRVYDALKPGGVFIIIDHTAPAGSGTKDTDTFHRIDPAAVKKEVEWVGFKFAGSSNALHNPKDPLDIAVFAKSIRGHTDQFIYRFRKPAK